MNKAIKWFKGTVTGKTLNSKGNEGYKDFETALKISKKEVFDDIDKIEHRDSYGCKDYRIYPKDLENLKKKHLSKKH